MYHYRFNQLNDGSRSYFSASLLVAHLLKIGVDLCVLNVLLVTLSFLCGLLVESDQEEKQSIANLDNFKKPKEGCGKLFFQLDFPFLLNPKYKSYCPGSGLNSTSQ